MTGPPQTPEDKLFDEALGWVAHLKAGEPTAADLEAFKSWRGQTNAHEEALKAALRIFELAGLAARTLPDKGGLPADGGDKEQPGPARGQLGPTAPRSRRLSRRLVVIGAIATAGAYGSVRPPLGLWPSWREFRADYRTGKGERRKLTIAEGISLELGTETSIAVKSVADEARVELISGQAFVAARSAFMPLVLIAGGGRVTTSDGSFDGRCLEGTVTVTCLGGTVTVERGGTATPLARGQQLTYSDSGLQPPVAVDPDRVSSWQSGQLLFRDQPLTSVVAEINRYRPGWIIITSGALNDRLVNATLDVDRLDDFFAQVEQLFGARITRLPGGIVVIS